MAGPVASRGWRIEPPAPNPSPQAGGERMCRASSVDQERKLALDVLVAALGDFAVEQAGGVVAGKVVVGELRAGRVARSGVHGPVEAVDREERQAVDAER